MGEVTREDLARIEREVKRTKVAAEAALAAIYGRNKVEQAAWDYRWYTGTPTYKAGLWSVAGKIEEALGVLTLEEATDHTREEFAAVRGVGPKAMEKLDAALAERGLSYADPATVGAV